MLPLILGAAALGGLAGLLKDKSSAEYGVNLDPASELEKQGSGYLNQGASQLSQLLQMGPGSADVTAGYDAQKGLADLLKQMSQQGGTDPTQADITGSNDLAAKLFAARRTALQQNQADQLTDANRQAALMGRSMNDPILRAKLAQEQTRQTSLLDAEQQGWATQKAMSNPYERLNLTGQRANLLGGLASQALANRQALAALGEGIMNNGCRVRCCGLIPESPDGPELPR
jgi:hypothetical protein